MREDKIEAGRRRIAGQGEDHREISGQRAPRARSFGHVRDLPPKDGSVDPTMASTMEWQVSPDRSKQLKAIADEAKAADTLILATDPDREGEAISWHVQEVLRQKKALPAEGRSA
jgi:DNA topoisomerase-1